jgi:hypothetical protein
MGAITFVEADALDQRSGRRMMPANDNRAPPPEARRRSLVTDRALADTNPLKQPNFSRTAFDPQHLAQFAGHVVLDWREEVDADGTKLGEALVRLPNIADIDLVVEFHGDRRRLWAEATVDTPRRCRRRLDAALTLLAGLIARAVGGEQIARMISEREGGGRP